MMMMKEGKNPTTHTHIPLSNLNKQQSFAFFSHIRGRKCCFCCCCVCRKQSKGDESRMSSQLRIYMERERERKGLS